MPLRVKLFFVETVAMIRTRSLTALALLLLSASAARAAVIELVNGDVLRGAVVEQTGEHVVFTHEVLGEIALPAAQVKAIREEPEPADTAPVTPAVSEAAPPAPAEAPPAASEDPEIFGIRFLPGWTRQFEAGINGSDGNSQTLNFRAAFMGDYEDEEDRWHVGSVFTRQTTDNDTTRNDFFAEAIRDWLVPGEKHFYFAQGRYDYDDFQSWRHRASLAAGVGYQFIKSDKFDLIGRVGGGPTYTWGGDGDDTLTPEALLGIEGTWRITENQAFEFKNTLYPNLGDAGEFRNLTTLAYVIAMNKAKGLSLKLGIENEYESQTDDDSKHNDLKYFAALVFDF